MKKLVVTLCLALAASALAADMRGQGVCGVPANQAAVLAVEGESGNWSGVGLRGAIVNTEVDPESALSSWASEATYVCEVEARINLRTVRGRFYSLPYELESGASSGDYDVRELIVGESASRIDPDWFCGEDVGNRSHCLFELREPAGCHAWIFRPNLQISRTLTWDGQCVDGMAHGNGRLETKWQGGGRIDEGRHERGVKVGVWRVFLEARPDWGWREEDYGSDLERVHFRRDN